MKIKWFIIFIIGLCLFFTFQLFAQERHTIVIIRSLDIAPYKQAFNGFRRQMYKKGFKPIFIEYNLEGDGKNINKLEIAKEIKSKSPDVIMTLGSGATLFAKNNFKNIPIVFSMVLNPVASGFVKNMRFPGYNITGAAMDIPIKEQFKILKDAIGKLGRIVVFYNPSETGPVVKRAENIASELGINFVPIRVNSERDVIEGLKKLSSGKDVLWAVADSFVYTPQTTQFIILETLRKGIPFMGVSASFVKAGALLALSCDYTNIGEQTADIVIQILQGSSPSHIPVNLPKKIQISINLNTAKHINIRLPDKIIKKAVNVF